MADFSRVIDGYLGKSPEILQWGSIPLMESSHKEHFLDWLKNGYHAELAYMEKNIEERLLPQNFKPWAKTIALFSMKYPNNMSPYIESGKKSNPKVAAYAKGMDYHHIAHKHLKNLEELLNPEQKENVFYGFVDTAPVFEREWAQKAGLGWSGKNSCNIHPKWGSGFFIFGFFWSRFFEENEQKKEVPNYCGSCNKCLVACPTKALESPGVLNSEKCISFQTIENKKEQPAELIPQFENWAFGCDICQQVCPWNSKHLTEQKEDPFSFSHLEWLKLLEKGNGGFKQKFKNTPLMRAGRKAMLRNILNILPQNPEGELLFQLRKMEKSEEGELQKKVTHILSKFE